MTKKRYCLLTFDGSDNVLIQKIAEHMGIPMIAVVRLAVRFYAANGPWPVDNNGLREEIISAATVAAAKARKAKSKGRAKA